MSPDMDRRHQQQQQQHSTREAAAPEALLDSNCNHRSQHDADCFGQNKPGDTTKYCNGLFADDNFSSNTLLHKHEGISRLTSTSSMDDRSIKSGEDSDGAESTNGKSSGRSRTEVSSLGSDCIWIPPEAADKEDETESFARSIAYDDEDDNYSDGIKWGQSSFPAPGDEHQASTHNARLEREKAMLEAMNGQLKILVSRLLASAGIASSKGEGSDSWLDIVTALSWEAALLIKPDARVGNEMDPGSYIKVKCIPSGNRRQSEVIKGLVFKKNAAHKHMPTACHNPRLLLLKGVLGHSDVGLSSFNSMYQEKDLLERAIAKMMEICSPNVIMVEKTVSRNIQELLLKEGVSLILDMKLHRLQRIERCTGSPVVSFSEVLDIPKLKQCDNFHIEKFIEEHNSTSEGGKMQSKTLMFLEGFPRPLGCTILLRGANSEELKKVKRVMQFTVFAAYHLILETSFFEDQRVFLNAKNVPKENSVTSTEEPSTIAHDVAVPGFPSYDESLALRLYHATSNGYADVTKTLRSPGSVDAPSPVTDSSANEDGGGATIRYDLRPPQNAERLTSPVPGPLRNLFANVLCHQNIYLPVTSSQETNDYQKEGRVESSQEKVTNGFHIGPKVEEPAVSSENEEHTNDLQKQGTTQIIMPTGSSTCDKNEEAPVIVENGEHHSTRIIIKDKYVDGDQADDALDSHSILILMSSQCITKQAICEQSHLTRIKYYGNFDVSLGRYLQDILQNQNLSCSSCEEPPEAHMYSYTHPNGNLTVLVKRLAPQYHLPGEPEGKIWMWTRCMRCDQEHGLSKSTPRVLISAEARNLSFGKFLELSFSCHSAARRLSICGHLVNRDCLRFFGLGSRVAMFRYSSVKIYTTCKPQPTLQFFNPMRQDWFEGERRHVHARGMMLFSEVAKLLQNMKNERPDALTLAISCGLSLPVRDFAELEELSMKEKDHFEVSLGKAIDQNGRPSSTVHELLNINWSYQDLLLELYIWDRRLHQLFNCKSVGLESVANSKNPIDTVDEISDDNFNNDKKIGEVNNKNPIDAAAPLFDECQESGHPELSCNGSSRDEESSIDPSRVNVESTAQTPKVCWNEISKDRELQGSVSVADPIPMEQEPWITPRYPYWDDRERWIWNSISESQLAYRNDIQVGYLEKFEIINHYSPSYLSPLFQHHEEVDTPQFAIGPGSNIMCVLEDEISSIIARALAVSDEHRHLMDSIVQNGMESTRGDHAKTMEKNYSFVSESSFSSSPWSSIGSLDSEASLSSLVSFSSDDLSGYDSSSLLSSLHPETTVNGKVTLKGKYSVTSIYANQFYALRKKCCPSELAYIASLSRCKKWDAQGGKSKAFFAKTMDDRFIIKQIKKTEFESFIKFAPEYFKHVYHSLDTGSQTCLAKILGIYQVKQMRHGKEVKIDLMVMENLLFGHNISRIYDLKGAIFSRHVADSDDCDTVYLDQNYIEDMHVSPIYIGGRTKHLLQRAIWNDTSFLTSVNVMDYSLLVGVDKQKHELVFGIIDYLRQYTWDKQLETWVKTSLVVPKNVSPTVISPREYKKRFRKFMAKYFLTVPDNWTPDNPCKASKSVGHSDHKLAEVQDGDSLLQHPIEAAARA